jgi:hypothetical protein
MSDDVLGQLGQALGLDPAGIACPWVFHQALDAALLHMSIAEVVAAVEGGSGQRQGVGWGAVLFRLRMLPARAAERQRVVVNQVDARICRRAAQLASLVADGLPLDAAEAELRLAFPASLDAASALAELCRYVAAIEQQVRS